ncbi:Sodium-dependent noradrenaline transporter [Trichoplax sp. H2]|nr:Sodium-dependent noradrenaline transporter [Trichoplax sp. H2]|eukprot:RDD42648.1 Sodium-dependent noradrenaline transporter [Trichoplax sp. H2]
MSSQKDNKMDLEGKQILNASDENTPVKRDKWDKKVEFFLSCIGYAVGFGNLWRFPYLCYDNGGGAFLIPYVIFLLTCGIPLMTLELAVGQYFRSGPAKAFYKACPLLGGTGYGMLTSLTYTGIFYNVIFAWVIFFLIASFITPLPWTNCDNIWNTPLCFVRNTSNANLSGTSPAQEFYLFRLLNISSGPNVLGPIRWELALLLLAAWVIVYFCVFRGIKWSGKVVYFTATFPYIVLIILFVRGLTLPGAANGIDYYLRVDTEKLKLAKTWRNAATQIFFSSGLAFGPIVTFASYNKKSDNVVRDAVFISVVNCATSFFCGFVVFSVLGYLSHQQGLPISRVVAQGPGLVFIVYPTALTTLPAANFWAIIFFFMLLTLGIDSLMGGMESLMAAVVDAKPKLAAYRPLIAFVACVILFFLGLVMTTQGGLYVLTLLNFYTAYIGTYIIAFMEIISVTYFYGGNRFAKNLQRVTGQPIYLPMRICWYIITPGMIVVFLLSLFN